METLVPLLPLTFVMIAGPQIISAVFLATSKDWAPNTLAYIAGAAMSITIIITAAYLVVKGAKGGSSASSKGGEGTTIDVILLVLLAYLAIRTYLGRHETEPPKWMGKLQEAQPGFSFKLGLLLLGVFPTDIVTSVTVGTRLAREGEPWWPSLIFVALTLLLLSIPALLIVLMGERAHAFLPKVRQWMNDNSWIVSEIVIALFIAIEINSLVGD